jgi:hypothetical protein
MRNCFTLWGIAFTVVKMRLEFQEMHSKVIEKNVTLPVFGDPFPV